MKINRNFIRISLITTVISMPCVLLLGNHLYEEIIANKQKAIQNQDRFKDISNLMMKNSYNTPLTMDVDKDNPLNVSLFNFTDEEKKEAINAINDLDEISENVNYSIIDNDRTKVTQHLTVTKVTDDQMKNLSGIRNSVGLTSFRYDNETATLTYPVNIYVSDFVDGIYDTNGVSLLSMVLKHEMMHSLGFKDLYTDEYLNKTIMYYQVSSDVEINDYTDFDKKNIKQVYDYTTTTLSEQYKNGNIKVEYPKFLQSFYETEKKYKKNIHDEEFTL